jgi:peptide-methionine (S)-S-oxide reductase
MASLAFRTLALVLVVASMACTVAVATVEIPDPAIDAPLATTKGENTAVLAGGCFWGVEAVFEHVKGVLDVKSGYAGGSAKTANYEMVSAGRTGHAESVQIKYDPSQVTYGQLLKVFFSVAHDPTQLNRQGPDTGPQYRSAIFYSGAEQKRIAQAYIDQLSKAKTYKDSIVTQVAELSSFYVAEPYHQDFVAHHPDHPYVVVHDLPKLSNLRKQLPLLVKSK